MTHSRTPRPPGATATTNPATVAKATAAVPFGQRLIPASGEPAENETPLAIAVKLKPWNPQAIVERTKPSHNSRQVTRGAACSPTESRNGKVASRARGNTQGVARSKNPIPGASAIRLIGAEFPSSTKDDRQTERFSADEQERGQHSSRRHEHKRFIQGREPRRHGAAHKEPPNPPARSPPTLSPARTLPGG